VRFIDEYIKDRNATQAYIPADYSAKGAKTEAYRLPEKPGVAAQVARRIEEYTRTAGIEPVKVL
jgi:phage terminase small subunit